MYAGQQGEQSRLLGNKSEDWGEVSVRHGFVCKVFGILFVQLLVTCAVAWPFVSNSEWALKILEDNPWMLWVAILSPFVVLIAFFCKPSLARTFPQNYILLAVFTAFEGICVGVTCAQYKTASVLGVAGITCIVAFGLMLFAMQTKYDFTGMGPYLFVALIVLTVFMFIFAFIPVSNTTHKIIAGCGALIFSMYIVYDTQLIVGGKHHSGQFEVDDYVIAAINIYLDILNLFLFLLQLFGERK